MSESRDTQDERDDGTALRAATRSLLSAQDLCAVRSALEAARAAVASLPPSPSPRAASAYATLAVAVLHRALPDWASAMPSADREQLLSPLFPSRAPAVAALSFAALCSALSLPPALGDKRTVGRIICELLEPFVSRGACGFANACAGLVASRRTLQRPDAERLLSALSSLPSRAGNVLGVDVPEWLHPRCVFREAARQVAASVSASAGSDEQGLLCEFAAELLAKSAVQGCAADAVQEVIDTMVQGSPAAAAITPADLGEGAGLRLLQCVFRSLPARAVENCLLAVVGRYARCSPDVVVSCCKGAMEGAAASTARHCRVSDAMIGLLETAGKSKMEELGVVPKVLAGISEHMSSSLSRVRRLGMKVAEKFSIVLDPSKPLKFDELLDDNANDEQKDGTPTEEASAVPELPPQQPKPKAKPVVLAPKDIDPDELFIPGEQPDDAPDTEAGGDDDDGLQAYDLTDDTSDVAGVRAPVYIRQCLAMLQKDRDNADAMEAVLGALPSIVRKRPDDLDEVSDSLCAQLLYLENKFNQENFQELRYQAMLALAVCSPKPVARYLTTQFYEPNHQLSTRMDILCVIAEAAQELSAVPKALRAKAQETPLIQEIKPTGKMEIVEGKTRRWHSVRPEPPKPVRNNFLAVSGDFFFPLMRSYDKRVQTLNLLGDDSCVLSKLFITLGIVYQCSVQRADIGKMMQTLLEFCEVVKSHSDASVRRSVVFAVGKVAESLGQDHVAEFVEGWRDWLIEEATEDPDEACRGLAASVLSFLQDTFA
eukprot:m51a1_g5618 putative telomere length regulation protein tel2 homolog (771) ;mRNA; f:756493-759364